MTRLPLHPFRTDAPQVDAAGWLRHLFSSKAAADGGVVRRKARDVERIVGRAVENGGQYVVFCNRGPGRVIA